MFASCGGGDSAVDPIHLAELYRPPASLIELEDGERAYKQRFEIAEDAWTSQQGLWRAPAPWYRSPLPVLTGAPSQLVMGGDMALRPASGNRPADVKDPGTFALVTLEDGDYVFARLGASAKPADAIVDVMVSAGAPGRARRGARGSVRPWRIEGGPLVGDGFLVREDGKLSFVSDVPPNCKLMFDAVVVGRRSEDVRLILEFETELLAEISLTPSPVHAVVPIEVELPEPGASGGFLTIALEGDAWCGLYSPRIAPIEPPAPERDDIVLFLADTFRADNMATYGGRPEITPNLDAFAAESLRVEQAWAPACWTLPSHASMFLGVDPMQHGAVDPLLTPAEGLTSIAEKLRAAGYRTAAITDSLFVSRRFLLDRGFEHFEEYNRRDIALTLRRAREIAARDDGRPLFLFVHTYRTHEPYVATEATRAALGDELGIGPTWDEMRLVVETEILKRVQAGDPNAREMLEEGDLHELLVMLGLLEPDNEEGNAFLASVRALYLGGVHDLDRAFGEFLDDLDARDRDSWVVFTSDHGEAFGEHESIFHGFGTWEENLRIPLVIRGPGLEPRGMSHPATLTDLPQTLAEMAGVAPDPAWGGTSLLSLSKDRPVFAFDCAQRGEPHGALIDGGLKVVFEPTAEAVRAGRVSWAYDLTLDPDERNDLGGSSRAKTALERLAEQALRRLELVAPPGAADLNETQRRQLEAAGYTGVDED